MKRNAILCCVFLLFPSLGLVRADEGVVIPEGALNPESLEAPNYILRLFASWKYHPGDRPEWADPEFDDDSWDTLDSLQTWLQPEMQAPVGWKGSGWFRLHLRVDSSLRDRLLALVYAQTGAAEIYLDGELIVALGQVGRDGETEEIRPLGQNNPKIIPIRFSHGADHVLAVRYSNFRALGYANPEVGSGFQMGLAELDHSIENKAALVRTMSVYQILFGVPLAFALLHFLLFVFYPESRENLYYALYAISTAALIFSPLQTSFLSTSTSINLFLLTFKASLVLIILFGLRFLYYIFFGVSPRFFRVPLFIGILLLLFSWAIPVPYLYIFCLGFFLEMLRVVVVAMWRKKEGARIIGFGYTMFGLACTYQVLIDVGIMRADYVYFPYIYGILMLMISMSVYLARDFARIHKDLKAQFVQVRELSIHLERANQQLEEHSRTLEQKVEERTREVSEKNLELEGTLHQLRETQHQLVLQEKMASLGNLVAGIVHEINTPVGAINSMHDTLVRTIDRLKEMLGSVLPQEGAGNQKFQSFFSVIANANQVIASGTERVIDIVRSLRSFARLDEAEFQVADLHEGLESTLKLLHSQMGEDINVVKEYGDIKPIYCSPSQLNQVFMHLLKNAIQAIEGSGEIRLETFADASKVYVRVSDSGPGIPPEQLERIFDFGFAAKSSRVKMGFGLSTSYTIIQDHEGDIKIDSQVGKGTEVTISLPMKGSSAG